MIDVFLTPALSRAARALLDWQQTDLAKAASLSLSAIKTFEQNPEVTRAQTRYAIVKAFEEDGIEFFSGGGLRHRDDVTSVIRFSGQDFLKKWNEDIYTSVKNSHSKILVSFAHNAVTHHPSVKETNKDYLTWCKKKEVWERHKILIPEGHQNFFFPQKSYRMLPAASLGKIHYSIYADRLAFVLWEKRQILVLRNTAIVETFRNQFSYLWKLGKPV